jgi:hypothetical protein
LQIVISDCNEELNYLYGSVSIVSVIKINADNAHIKFVRNTTWEV